jgi:hypothetical protein
MRLINPKGLDVSRFSFADSPPGAPPAFPLMDTACMIGRVQSGHPVPCAFSLFSFSFPGPVEPVSSSLEPSSASASASQRRSNQHRGPRPVAFAPSSSSAGAGAGTLRPSVGRLPPLSLLLSSPLLSPSFTTRSSAFCSASAPDAGTHEEIDPMLLVAFPSLQLG